MIDLLIISVSVSFLILVIIAISPLLNKKYGAKTRYYIWMILAIRLIIPYRPQFVEAPVQLPENIPGVFVLAPASSDSSLGILEYYYDDSYTQKAVMLEDSAAYSPVFSLENLMKFIWICVAFALFSTHLLRYFLFKKMVYKECIKTDDDYFISSKIRSPMLLGFFKPTIILPANKYSQEEIDVILKHERTHWRRGDIWYKLLLLVANSVHWFNPVIYVMVKKAVRDIEYSCDDIVVSDMDDENKKIYAMIILNSMKGKNKL